MSASEDLAVRFAEWHEPIGPLLSATDADSIVRTEIYDRERAVPTSHEWIVLVGDAAHPMRPCLGQGGCQAIAVRQ